MQHNVHTPFVDIARKSTNFFSSPSITCLTMTPAIRKLWSDNGHVKPRDLSDNLGSYLGLRVVNPHLTNAVIEYYSARSIAHAL